MMKWIVSLFIFLFSLAVIGVAGFYFTIFLIGPHSDILPDDVHIPVGLFLLTLIIGISFLLGMKSFNYLKRKEQNIIREKEFGN